MSQFDGQIDVLDMLERMGVDKAHPASGGQEVKFSCPFHTDERPSAYMNATTTAWFCWSCKQRGKSAITFVGRVMEVPYATAETWIKEAYGVEFSEPRGGSMTAETEARFAALAQLPELVKPSPSWQDQFTHDLWRPVGEEALAYIRGRGFKDETLEAWGLGYDAIDNRLTIPVHDLYGRLVGFKGRSLEEGSSPKYMIMGDRASASYGFDPYEASQVVFGLDRHGPPNVVLCEGELDAIALSQAGVMRPIAIGMSYLTDEHVKLIVSEAQEVVVFFDDDQAGADGLWGHTASSGAKLPGLIEKLQPHVVVKIVPSHEGDPASMDRVHAVDLIEAAGGTVARSTVFV